MRIFNFVLAPILAMVASSSHAQMDDENNRIAETYYEDLEDVYNPSWEELLPDLVVGQNYPGPVFGSTIRVDHNAVEQNIIDSDIKNRTIARPISLHVPISSFIGSHAFANVSRWYQEDGNTQIFRMFPGEDNVRNERVDAPRSEVGSLIKWKRGDGWHEFSAHYTFIKVRPGCVFQLKHNFRFWSVMLELHENEASPGVFDLYYERLRDKESKTLLVKDVVNKGVDIRFLDNGDDHKVLINGELRVEATFANRTDDEENVPRWGLYSPRSAMDRDILIFITGAYAGKAQDLNLMGPSEEISVPDVFVQAAEREDQEQERLRDAVNATATINPSTMIPNTAVPSASQTTIRPATEAKQKEDEFFVPTDNTVSSADEEDEQEAAKDLDDVITGAFSSARNARLDSFLPILMMMASLLSVTIMGVNKYDCS